MARIPFRRGLENALTRLVAAAPKQRNPSAEARLRNEVAALDERAREIDKTIARDFPKFSETMSLNSLGLAEARGLLSREEALLAYFVADEESYVWVLRHDGATLQRIDIGSDELEELEVRAALFRQCWGLTLTYTQRPDEKTLMAGISLKGLGSFPDEGADR